MVLPLRNVNPCAQFKNIPNVIHILRESKNSRYLLMIPTVRAKRRDVLQVFKLCGIIFATKICDICRYVDKMVEYVTVFNPF